MSEILSMQRKASRKIADLDDHHQHSLAKWWVSVERAVRDCVTNPYILESESVRLVGAFGRGAFDRAIAEREGR